ncbi:MAG: dihydrofolate reductase [Planctomycetota bacterium]
MKIAVAVAVARNGVIGNKGQLPWHLPEDLKRFKKLTLGHTVIMGRKTYESIGKPLPGRRNIVLSTGPSIQGVEVMRSLPEALAAVRRDKAEVAFVIGGHSVFREAMMLADSFHLTQVDLEPEGDTLFPPYNKKDWKETHRETSGPCTFIDYVRVES